MADGLISLGFEPAGGWAQTNPDKGGLGNVIRKVGETIRGHKNGKGRAGSGGLAFVQFVAGRWRLTREASQKSDSTCEAGTKKQKSRRNRGG